MRKRIVIAAALLFHFALALTYAQTTDFFALVKFETPQRIQASIDQGEDVNAQDKEGWTVLMAASMFNPNPAVLTTLLKAGADINARDESGMTPLIWAVSNNVCPEVITTLLKAGSDVNAQDKAGLSALMMAAECNTNPEMITTLLKAGADGKAKDKKEKTAFDYAQGNARLKGTDAYRKLKRSVVVDGKEGTAQDVRSHDASYEHGSREGVLYGNRL